MEKASLISDDGTDCQEDGIQSTPAEMPRIAAALRARFALPPACQVLVTFRGVAVEESLVRYVQRRASELGLTEVDILHVVLSDAGAVVRASIGPHRLEHGAVGTDAQQIVKAALDALAVDRARASM
jgi:2,4-dienoyl-CoA reductase-like NADH-dependent reductase (Old Yellow Enzyme family)